MDTLYIYAAYVGFDSYKTKENLRSCFSFVTFNHFGSMLSRASAFCRHFLIDVFHSLRSTVKVITQWPHEESKQAEY